jgi:hypothetical protein
VSSTDARLLAAERAAKDDPAELSRLRRERCRAGTCCAHADLADHDLKRQVWWFMADPTGWVNPLYGRCTRAEAIREVEKNLRTAWPDLKAAGWVPTKARIAVLRGR